MMRFAPLVVVLLLLSSRCVATDVTEADDGTGVSSVFYVSTLLPGYGSCPPQFTLTLDAPKTEFEIRTLDGNWAERAAQWVVSALGGVQDRVPQERHDLCHFPHAPEAFSVRFSRAHPVCNQEVFSRFPVDSLLTGREFHHVLPDDERLPLSVEVHRECVRTPFLLSSVSLHVLKNGHMVAVLGLWDESKLPQNSACSAWFELRESVEDGENPQRKSFFAPVVMLAVVVGLRTLPRYFLTRHGQLDHDSYKGTVPKLSPARLAELKRQQQEIIARMKEEDARNGVHEKTD